ncbi:ATP-binding cassette domain-containing protein, partial [Amylibacter sp.]|nr:ATP-binding cassette domain-containing protein [Amylibacter sp.]
MANAKKQLQVSDEVAIQITNMNKWYGSFHVLRDIDLTVNRGERIVIAGPSGSGKSTLIRCINALEEHQEGLITVDGTELSSDLKNIATRCDSCIGFHVRSLVRLKATRDEISEALEMATFMGGGPSYA